MCARSTAALEAAAEHIRQQYNVDVLSQTVDVTNADAVHGFVEAVVSRFGASRYLHHELGWAARQRISRGVAGGLAEGD